MAKKIVFTIHFATINTRSRGTKSIPSGIFTIHFATINTRFNFI